MVKLFLVSYAHPYFHNQKPTRLYDFRHVTFATELQTGNCMLYLWSTGYQKGGWPYKK
jgi:hypothetical protein